MLTCAEMCPYPQLLLEQAQDQVPTPPGSNLGYLLCPPPAHLQGLQTGAWSGPRWRRSHCTGGPDCAAPGPLRPSGGGCWTSADLDTQSHSSGAVAVAKCADLTLFPVVLALDPQLSDLTIHNLRKEPPSPVGSKSLCLFHFLTFVCCLGRGCHCTLYRSENNLWEWVLSFHHGVCTLGRVHL